MTPLFLMQAAEAGTGLEWMILMSFLLPALLLIALLFLGRRVT